MYNYNSCKSERGKIGILAIFFFEIRGTMNSFDNFTIFQGHFLY